jgi:hypothetical protein
LDLHISLLGVALGLNRCLELVQCILNRRLPMRPVVLLCAELGYTLFALFVELVYTLLGNPRVVLDRGARGAFCVGFVRRARRVGFAGLLLGWLSSGRIAWCS